MSDDDAYKMLFMFVDKDGDGKVTADDMKGVWGAVFGTAEDMIGEMMGGDSLDEGGFVAMMQKLKPKEDMDNIMAALSVFDYTPGVINLKTFGKTLTAMGEKPLTQAEMDRFEKDCDLDGTGNWLYPTTGEFMVSSNACVNTSHDPPEVIE
jgi:Ca2+-binding EF-hand superfamily protein